MANAESEPEKKATDEISALCTASGSVDTTFQADHNGGRAIRPGPELYDGEWRTRKAPNLLYHFRDVQGERDRAISPAVLQLTAVLEGRRMSLPDPLERLSRI